MQKIYVIEDDESICEIVLYALNSADFDYEGESRSLDMHIRSLRKKLGTTGEYIKTICNVGYILEE